MGRGKLLSLAQQHTSNRQGIRSPRSLAQNFLFPLHLLFLFINPQAYHLLYLTPYRKFCTFLFIVAKFFFHCTKSILRLACSGRMMLERRKRAAESLSASYGQFLYKLLLTIMSCNPHILYQVCITFILLIRKWAQRG